MKVQPGEMCLAGAETQIEDLEDSTADPKADWTQEDLLRDCFCFVLIWR